ncbi:MAG: phosphoglucosamine mutase, partial [Terracidiphilus sp.]
MSPNGARKLFGTDGIRAVAGDFPLDPTTIYSVGLALGHTLHRSSLQPKVILGRDTRESGPWIAAILAEGLRKAGAIVESAGVVTTPAVAFLARTHGYQAGVVISASHNPWADNGIKLFGDDGLKFPDAAELAMEEEILHHAAQVEISDPHSFPPADDKPAFQADYIQFLIECVPGLSLSGLEIVADCANGAAAAIAPELLRRLNGGRIDGITLLNIAPNGRNINANCGALHPDFVAREVKARGADLGLTFDGDA